MERLALMTVSTCLLVLVGTALAHQPRIVSDELAQVQNPEVSQAFYGQLKGKPDYYKINSEQPFRLYVGILVPDLEAIGKDVSVEITKEHEHRAEEAEHKHEEEEIRILLNGLDHEWTRWYEPFGGDWYYEGPELRSNPPEEELPQGVEVGEGTYTIKVFSPHNEGKYVLAVGEREEFPLNEIVSTLFVLPRLKAEFFERSPLTAYFNLIGLFMAVSIGILIAIIVGVVMIVKRVRKKGGMRLTSTS